MPHEDAISNDALREAPEPGSIDQDNVESVDLGKHWHAREIWLLGELVLERVLA